MNAEIVKIEMVVVFLVIRASLVAQLVKNPPAMREAWVWSLGWEDPTRKKLPTPVFLLGEFQGLYGPWGCKESETTERLSLSHSTYWPRIWILKACRWFVCTLRYDQEALISLSSLSIWGQTGWKPQPQNTNQTDHIDHILVLLNETMSYAM